MHVFGGMHKGKHWKPSVQARACSVRSDWIPKTRETRDLVSPIIFSRVAAWVCGTLTNIEKMSFLSKQQHDKRKQNLTSFVGSTVKMDCSSDLFLQQYNYLL